MTKRSAMRRRQKVGPKARVEGHPALGGRVVLPLRHASNSIPAVQVTTEVLDAIRATVGVLPAETGGLLGRDPETGLICRFFFDEAASCSRTTYSPDVDTVNQVLSEWNAEGIRFAGFVHSHPRGLGQLSSGDLIYAERILHHIDDLDTLVLPVVLSNADQGAFTINPFLVRLQK